MSQYEDKLKDYFPQMICTSCGSSKLGLEADSISCKSCKKVYPRKEEIPLMLEEPSFAYNVSRKNFMEVLFRFPFLYKLKTELQRRINRIDNIDLKPYLDGTHALDLGCGPYPVSYDENRVDKLVGIDSSWEFISKNNSRNPNNFYLVSKAEKIPFADKTFDSTIIHYVLHHIPIDTRIILDEAIRVTRNYVIVFDHIRSDTAWKSFIQENYWKLSDSGCYYHTMADWKRVSQGLNIIEERCTGSIFKNIYEMIIKVD